MKNDNFFSKKNCTDCRVLIFQAIAIALSEKLVIQNSYTQTILFLYIIIFYYIFSYYILYSKLHTYISLFSINIKMINKDE